MEREALVWSQIRCGIHDFQYVHFLLQFLCRFSFLPKRFGVAVLTRTSARIGRTFTLRWTEPTL